MRKRHFIDKINVKTLKSIEIAIFDIQVGAMLKMSNFVCVWLSDVDFIFCIKDCVLEYHPILRLNW